MYNYVLTSAVAGWVVAQIIKTILYLIQHKDFDVERLFGAGGMPSGHTAMVIGASVGIARTEGTNTTIFAVMVILAAIVIYDAMGVRRAAGLHAQELNNINAFFAKLLKKAPKEITEGTEEYEYKKLKEYLGHTPLEVLAGAALGVISAFVFPVK